MGIQFDAAMSAGDDRVVGAAKAVVKAAANSQSTAAALAELQHVLWGFSQSQNLGPNTRLADDAAALTDLQT